MATRREVEEEIEPGLIYTEETGRIQQSNPVRDCFLLQAGVVEPICGLNVVSFRQRFGAVSVPAEGIGGVETRPPFRRKGYVTRLLRRSIEGIGKRVSVVFVSDGIEDLYEKFGFVTCLAEGRLSLPVRNLERCAGKDKGSSKRVVRDFSPADLPMIAALYNEAHARRPWTHVRSADWNQLLVTQTWQPGSEPLILECDEEVVGYALLKERQYGHLVSTLVVDELAARDVEAAYALLVEVASRCWDMRLSHFQVREPFDSAVGRAAQRLGCDYCQTFPASGGMMGAILDRHRLLRLLEPELQRRLPDNELRSVHTSAFEALCQGEVISDNQALLRLLVGYRSAADERACGTVIPEEYKRVVDAWFPGGGTLVLPMPYAHTLDRY